MDKVKERLDVLEKKNHMCWAVGSEIDEHMELLSGRIDALEAAQSVDTKKNITFSFLANRIDELETAMNTDSK